MPSPEQESKLRTMLEEAKDPKAPAQQRDDSHALEDMDSIRHCLERQQEQIDSSCQLTEYLVTAHMALRDDHVRLCAEHQVLRDLLVQARVLGYGQLERLLAARDASDALMEALLLFPEASERLLSYAGKVAVGRLATSSRLAAEALFPAIGVPQKLPPAKFSPMPHITCSTAQTRGQAGASKWSCLPTATSRGNSLGRNWLSGRAGPATAPLPAQRPGPSPREGGPGGVHIGNNSAAVAAKSDAARAAPCLQVRVHHGDRAAARPRQRPTVFGRDRSPTGARTSSASAGRRRATLLLMMQAPRPVRTVATHLGPGATFQLVSVSRRFRDRWLPGAQAAVCWQISKRPGIYLFGGESAPSKLVTSVEWLSLATTCTGNGVEALQGPKVVGEMPRPRKAFLSTYLKGKIYVAGGTDGKACLSTFESYDPATGEWEMLKPIPEPCSVSSLVPLGSSLFVLGLHSDPAPAGPMCASLCYSSETFTWRHFAEPLFPNCGYFGAAACGRLYAVAYVQAGVVNGCKVYDPSPEDRCVQVFLPETEQWQAAPCVYPHIRIVRGVAVLRDKLFVIGARLGEFRVLRCAEGQWDARLRTPLPPRSFERLSPSLAVAVGDLLMIFGGWDDEQGNSVSGAVALDCAKERPQWVLVPKFSVRRQGHSAAAVDCTS